MRKYLDAGGNIRVIKLVDVIKDYYCRGVSKDELWDELCYRFQKQYPNASTEAIYARVEKLMESLENI